jgi:hypothetical protein
MEGDIHSFGDAKHKCGRGAIKFADELQGCSECSFIDAVNRMGFAEPARSTGPQQAGDYVASVRAFCARAASRQ